MTHRLLPLLLLTLAASGAAQQSIPAIQVGRPPLQSRYVVEFHATPAVLAPAGTSASAYDSLFDQFERDLRGEVTSSSDVVTPRRTVREFRLLLVAAVVDLHPATADRVRRLPYVRSVRIDHMAHALGAPRTIEPTATRDPRSRVNASSLGHGQGVVVAIIDSGVDYMHPGLGGGLGAGFKVRGGYDFINDDDDPMDDNGHGTHVAGIVAATSAEVTGVAPQVTLLAYKVLDASGSGPTSGIIAAIERAVDPDGDGDTSDHADVINLSLGGPGDADDPISRAVDNATAAGAVVIVAAGNAGRVSTVSSPGVARQALTVAAIDDDDRMATFSSRGPSPRSLAFKPDVAAGGDNIVSTLPGFRFGALSGTSMAAPHVAGVAALLLERHPDWSPERVKMAIANTAASVSASPFARGAGKADTLAADGATLSADVSGLSFGIRPSRIGTSSATQTVRLTNHSSAAQTVTLKSIGTPAGAVVTLSPATLTVPAGGRAEFSVGLSTDNETLEFPEEWLVGGDIEVQGASRIRIPWGILRASRATVTFDGIMSTIVATDPSGGWGQMVPDPAGVEIFLPSGRAFDFMLHGWDPVDEGQPVRTQRTIVRAGVMIDGDHRIDLRRDEATLRIVADARDENGVPLRDRESSGDDSLHLVSTRVMRFDEELVFSLGLLEHAADVDTSWLSPLPDNYRIRVGEQYVDAEQRSVYVVEHPPLTGLDETVQLTGGGEDLLVARVVPAPPSRGLAASAEICFHDAITAILSFSMQSCFVDAPVDGTPLRVLITPERFELAHTGLVIRQPAVATQALRGRGDRIVMSSEETPSPVTRQLHDDETFYVADGLVHPFALPGSKQGSWFRFPFGGYYGSGGESLSAGEGVDWITFDSSGRQTGIGSFRDGGGVLPIPPSPGSRFVAVRNDLPVGNRRTTGTLDVRFGRLETDLDAPTLTSLRLVDARGTGARTIAPGEPFMISFSIADLAFASAAASRESRPELTRVYWRRSGFGGEWTAIPVRMTGSDYGSQATLKRYPAGEIYEAAIPIASPADAGWYDLRIEFEDAPGNHVEWIQEFALTVGAPEAPPRRRGARH